MWSVISLYAHTFSCAAHRWPKLVCGLNLVHGAVSSCGNTRWPSQPQPSVSASSGMGGDPAGSWNVQRCPLFRVGSLFEDTGWVGRVVWVRLGLTGKVLWEEWSGPWAESLFWPWLGLHHAESWRALKMCIAAVSLLGLHAEVRRYEPGWGAVPLWWRFAVHVDCCISTWRSVTGMVWICVWVADHHHSTAFWVREISPVLGRTKTLWLQCSWTIAQEDNMQGREGTMTSGDIWKTGGCAHKTSNTVLLSCLHL